MAFSIAGDIKSKMVPPTGPTTGVQVVLGHGEGDIVSFILFLDNYGGMY